jgi:hypothetical protein
MLAALEQDHWFLDIALELVPASLLTLPFATPVPVSLLLILCVWRGIWLTLVLTTGLAVAEGPTIPSPVRPQAHSTDSKIAAEITKTAFLFMIFSLFFRFQAYYLHMFTNLC